MKTLKIEIPEGYSIDQEKSTFEEIVFRKNIEKLPIDYFYLETIEGYSLTEKGIQEVTDPHVKGNNLVFASVSEVKASIYLAELSVLRKVYRQGWVPDWTNSKQLKYTMVLKNGLYRPYQYRTTPCFLTFQSKEIAEKFFMNFHDKIQKAKVFLS